jgi:hypothetical protein
VELAAVTDMPTDPAPPDTLPPRLAWFAVWRWRRRYQIAVGLPGVFCAYLLSIGPAAWLVNEGYVRSNTVEIVYRPVLAAVFRRFDDESVTTPSDYLVWYMDQWGPWGSREIDNDHTEWEIRND